MAGTKGCCVHALPPWTPAPVTRIGCRGAPGCALPIAHPLLICLLRRSGLTATQPQVPTGGLSHQGALPSPLFPFPLGNPTSFPSLSSLGDYSSWPCSTMSASLQRNIIPQDIAGYIELADELKAFLKAEYPQVPEAEFQVKVCSPPPTMPSQALIPADVEHQRPLGFQSARASF